MEVPKCHANNTFAMVTATNSDVDAGDKFGRTPLMFCVLGDRMDCAEMLIKAGANVNQKDFGGRTALHWAAHRVCLQPEISFQKFN